MLALRVCLIQFVGYQECYVWPNGRWGELHVQYWSAQWERPMGAASDICCHKHLGKYHFGSEVGQGQGQVGG
jgi:hypothetical protein